MAKPKNIPGYVYCSLCDIYYSKKIFDKAEEEKARRLKSEEDEYIRRMVHHITGCPMCQAKTREALHSLSLSFRDEHSGPIRPHSRMRMIKSTGAPKKLIIIKRKVK